jgi:predicted TIM-barrel fold metal-dependent hydrolase
MPTQVKESSGTARTYRVIDADSHVVEPSAALLVTDPDILVRAGVPVPEPGQQVRQPMGSAVMGDGKRAGLGHPGGFDPKVRLDVYGEEGIDQGVFFPTSALAHLPNLEFGKIVLHAYNDWLAEYCSPAPDRLFGACAVHLGDPEGAVDELRRCVNELGFRAVFLRPCLYIEGTQWWDDVYHPFWRAATELDVAVAFHPFPADQMPGAGKYFRLNDPASGDPAAFFRTPFIHPVDAMFTLGSLISGGVLERYPTLRIGVIESSGGWIVPFLERLDGRYEHLAGGNIFFGGSERLLERMTMAPSEYFKRQCWISFDPTESSIEFTAGQIGADRIMVGSDFPHPDSFYPGFVEGTIENISRLSEKERTLVLGESARAFYKLP